MACGLAIIIYFKDYIDLLGIHEIILFFYIITDLCFSQIDEL